MNEMDVQPVDLGDELRQRIEPRLDLPPVVVRLPIAHELLQGRQRHALGFIRDGLLFGPPCGRETAAKVDEVLLGNIDAERTDCIGPRLPTRTTEETGSPHQRLQFPSQQCSRAGVGSD